MGRTVVRATPTRYIIMEDGKAVLQGDIKDRSDEDILKANSGPSKPAPQAPKSPMGMFRDPNIQQQALGAGKAAGPTLDAAKKLADLQEPDKKKNIPQASADSLDAVTGAIALNQVGYQLKTKNKINTGPVASLMEKSGINNLLDRDRPAVQSMIGLHTVNPYRKLVTGAAAAEIELRNFIVPAIPNFSDNDKRYVAKSFLYDLIMNYNKNVMLEGLENRGYDVGEYKSSKIKVMGMDGKAMNEFQTKATFWALKNISSPEFEAKATAILKRNGIDPKDVMTLDTWVAQNSDEFDKMDAPTQAAARDSQIQNAQNLVEK